MEVFWQNKKPGGDRVFYCNINGILQRGWENFSHSNKGVYVFCECLSHLLCYTIRQNSARTFLFVHIFVKKVTLLVVSFSLTLFTPSGILRQFFSYRPFIRNNSVSISSKYCSNTFIASSIGSFDVISTPAFFNTSIG